jgi:hypothetical protein
MRDDMLRRGTFVAALPLKDDKIRNLACAMLWGTFYPTQPRFGGAFL